MNARALITAVFALFTIGCVDFFEVPPSHAECWTEYEGWATWCDEAHNYLDRCDDQIDQVERWCDDVYDDLDDCEHDNGVGAWQCDTYLRQVDDCQTQWDEAHIDRDDAVFQVRHACGNADEIEQTCLAL